MTLPFPVAHFLCTPCCRDTQGNFQDLPAAGGAVLQRPVSAVLPIEEHDGVVQIAVGLSTALDACAAAAEASVLARDQLKGVTPTLAVLLASQHHAAHAQSVLEVVHEFAQPDALVGCVAEAVVAGRREIEGVPAVVLWLAVLPAAAETFHMEFLRTPTGGIFGGYQFDRAGTDLHLLLPDPHTFPTHYLFAHLNTHAPRTTVMGGLASGADEPGLTRLFCDAEMFASGAVGARLPGLRARPVVSQGCRPIGNPYTVTRAEGTLITELAGRPPLQLLEEIVTRLPLQDQALVSRGLHIGLAIDEYKSELARGDFLIRAVTGADEATGAIGVGDLVDIGTTVQFQVRDAATADEDLRESLLRARAEGRPVGALLFTCNGRGTRMFDGPDHDARLVSDLLGGVPVAGFFAAGELGPVGGKNYLHGFTASIALFDDELHPLAKTRT
jgi:small ligand-binding sensory domain FIST